MDMLHARLIEHCKRHLPNYMWPFRLHFVSNIPLKANGKVDNLNLSQMPSLMQRLVPRQMSRTEGKLLQMVTNCLNKQENETGIELTFFDLGGHSLLIGRLIHQIQAEFSVSLTYQQFFEGSSIVELAEVIDAKKLVKILSAKQTKTSKMTI